MFVKAFSNETLASRTLAVRRISFLAGLDSKSSNDQFILYSKKFLENYEHSNDADKQSLLVGLAKDHGVNSVALKNAVKLYEKNEAFYPEVRQAATPLFHKLIGTIGNTPEGVKKIVNMRAEILKKIRTEKDKETFAQLKLIEQSCREHLTSWFCLSSLKLKRLTFESPGDILYKVAAKEAVHKVRGLSDMRQRLGPLRRCFYFLHESLPREPLVMVHVALTDHISSSVQKITRIADLNDREEDQTTAIYYSITSTQPGLSSIDLGNFLIKQVATQLQKDVPSIKVHSTLSPVPGFRTWLLRNLHGNSEHESVIDDQILVWLNEIVEKDLTKEQAAKHLLSVLSPEVVEQDVLESLKKVLIRSCAKYLCEAKKDGFALNPVANFHMRNGSELYRINWKGDLSARGLSNSFGIMVNYRYVIDQIHSNSQIYQTEKQMNLHDNVSSLLQ